MVKKLLDDLEKWLDNQGDECRPEYDLVRDCPAEYKADWMLVQIIRAQQARIDALERQVAQLVEDNPRTREKQPLPPNWAKNIMAQDARRVARHRRDFEEIAQLEGKTVAQVEGDLCKGDGKC